MSLLSQAVTQERCVWGEVSHQNILCPRHFTCSFADLNWGWRIVIEVNPSVWKGNKFPGSWACSSRTILLSLLEVSATLPTPFKSNSNFFDTSCSFDASFWRKRLTNKQTKILWSAVITGAKLFNLVQQPTEKKKFKKTMTKLALMLINNIAGTRAKQGWQRQAP